MDNEWTKFKSKVKGVYSENSTLIDGVSIYIILLVLVYIVLVEFVPVEIVTGVGQFFADWLLFPTVVVGFWIAIKEFRQSQIKPVLNLFWSTDRAVGLERDSFIFKTSEFYDKTYFLRLHVQNNSEIIVVWYRIAIDLPRELIGWNDEKYSLQWHQGEDRNWNSNVNPERVQHEFRSNGEYALFPGDGVHVATLEIHIPQHSNPHQGKIHSSVVTDKTKIIYIDQEYKIRMENFSR